VTELTANIMPLEVLGEVCVKRFLYLGFTACVGWLPFVDQVINRPHRIHEVKPEIPQGLSNVNYHENYCGCIFYAMQELSVVYSGQPLFFREFPKVLFFISCAREDAGISD
jgi:hypothetical protein